MSINKKDLKEFILKAGREAVEANKPRHKNIDEWTKRFEALRSTSSLDDDVKKSPWRGAANVPIPIDATVVYTILARLVKATWGVDPAISVRPTDMNTSLAIQRYINWEMWEEMRLFMDLMLGYQGMLIDGDKIMKTGVEKEEIYFDDDMLMFMNAKGEPYLSPSTGIPVEAESEDQPSIFDPQTMEEFKPQRGEYQKTRTTYYGPTVTNCPVKSIIVPTDANHTDPSKCAWIMHEFWMPYWWIHQKFENHPEVFNDKDELNKLYDEKDNERPLPKDDKLQTLGIELKTKTKMFKFWEWHGKFEDDKGNPHELIALLAPDQKAFLGFVSNRFFFKTGRRQFVHYTCFPMDGRFWGKGVPEWLRGIRSMLDAMINTALDRNALFNNPPLLYDMLNSGFDPAEHKFGPGKTWGLRAVASDKIRLLDMPPQEQTSIIREEMLFNIVQKLFGVTDFSLAGQKGMGHGGAQNRTYGGVSAIINEGNIRFDVLIKLVQEVANPDLAFQVFRHFSMNRYSIMKEKGLNKPKEIFDPIMKLSEDEIAGNFDYVFRGNTSTVNPMIEQQQVSYLYDKFTQTRNPFIVDDPDVMHDLTESMIMNYGGVNGLKIKSVDDFRRMSAQSPMDAKKVREQAIKEKLGVGGGDPNAGIGG